MNWHQAFVAQATSDFSMLRALPHETAYAHRLHYLQMAAEKLSKAVLIGPSGASPPDATHAVFVRMLQTLKGQPGIRRALGFDQATVFSEYVKSLLDTARNIERLAPALAGFTQPNPEYPWKDSQSGNVVAPCTHDFPEFRTGDPKLIKISALIERLLQIYSIAG